MVEKSPHKLVTIAIRTIERNRRHPQNVRLSPVAENANSVPGFPQDAFMEMSMDAVVERPETHGLPSNWSAGMMGMMTMVRVLPDREFDEIQDRIRTRDEKKEHHS